MPRFHAALGLAAVLLCACASKPLVEPAPIPIGPEADAAQAIKFSLPQRGWYVIAEEAGVIRAGLNVRTHHAVVDISYSDSEISIEHVSSRDLDERVNDDGELVIHPRYLSWLENLRTDIERNLLYLQQQ